jgi:hypothetical protein
VAGCFFGFPVALGGDFGSETTASQANGQSLQTTIKLKSFAGAATAYPV